MSQSARMVSPFGFKLASVNSTPDRRHVTGPPVRRRRFRSISAPIRMPGDKISFGLTLPDGSSQTITLQATTTSPPGADQFTIGASADATATNLQAAMTTAVGESRPDRAAGGLRHRRRQ